LTDQVANIATQPGVLLVESTDVRRLADDDVLHLVEQLSACRVSRKVERFAQCVPGTVNLMQGANSGAV
jgi:hypothetical protein